jgi:hypothetical protein
MPFVVYRCTKRGEIPGERCGTKWTVQGISDRGTVIVPGNRSKCPKCGAKGLRQKVF